MKIAAIYCRVSTEDQEREGTSLQTQLEACLKYCQDKGYDMAHRFSEAYSGLALERPKLNELREMVRAGTIDIVVCYCLDRLSRDPVHGVILLEEFEKHHVVLEAVTETIDSSEVGKLINYIRGFASKLEASKIRERTMRGRRARAKEGRIPGGGSARLYGYDYVSASQKNGGRRVINEPEAIWVRRMYEWLTDEGLSTNGILYRLRAHNAPTKFGKPWNRRSVQAILRNPAYTGKTFLFTTQNGKRFARPREDWVEIHDATPPITSQELFDAAQKQLRVNQDKSPRNCRHEYLLRGHVRCRKCGRTYGGSIARTTANGRQWRYTCLGTVKKAAPDTRCHNKGWRCDKLEELVWAKLAEYLSTPELIIAELEKQRRGATQLGGLEAELERIERQLKAVDHEQHQLLQWALKDFPAHQVEAENRRLNKARETLTAQQGELAAQIKTSQTAAINVPKLESFIERMQEKIGSLDFAGKRQVLDMLAITVWLDGGTIEVAGVIDPEDAIVHTHSYKLFPLHRQGEGLG